VRFSNSFVWAPILSSDLNYWEKIGKLVFFMMTVPIVGIFHLIGDVLREITSHPTPLILLTKS
jgi:hypothetical protein